MTTAARQVDDAATINLNALDPVIWPRGRPQARRRARPSAAWTCGIWPVQFGTPLFACDEADFRGRCRDFRAAFGGGAVCYAAKAFCSREVLRWAAAEGLGVDVCTEGELETALSAGLPGEIITMHGNNKTVAELAQAHRRELSGHIVLDSFEEIARLAYLAEQRGIRPKVLVRVTTGVDARTHEYIATALEDQKFGFSLASGAAAEAVRRVVASPDLELAGLHSHIGSQITDAAQFVAAARLMVGLAAAVKDEHGVQIGELDLGGGFGIAYTPGDRPTDPAAIARILTGTVESACAAAGLRRPRLTVEPGRAIAGPGTMTIYEVGTIKDVPFDGGLRSYVSVDGGMSDNIRTALYDARYTCVLASRESGAPPALSRVVGRHCESGDIVVRDAYLPSDLAPGDLLAVAATEAYCRSAASNYNHVPRPPVIAVTGRRGAGPGPARDASATCCRLDAR